VEKNRWNNSTWETIDFAIMHRVPRKLSTNDQNWTIKLLYNQLPLGIHRFKTATVNDSNLALCTCCKFTVEDRNHFLTCTKNPHFDSGLRDFKATILGRPDVKNLHLFNKIFVDLHEQWLQHGPQTPAMDRSILTNLDYHGLPDELLRDIHIDILWLSYDSKFIQQRAMYLSW
jgi:hypothetical protein